MNACLLDFLLSYAYHNFFILTGFSIPCLETCATQSGLGLPRKINLLIQSPTDMPTHRLTSYRQPSIENLISGVILPLSASR